MPSSYPLRQAEHTTGIPWRSIQARALSIFQHGEGSVFLNAPDKNWKSNPTLWNRGEDPYDEGPLVARMLAAPPMTGHLVVWNPVEQKEAWRADLPVVESGGVLATAGNLVFQGR